MSEEWGPWIEHDGKGCPVRGMVIEAVWLVQRFSRETANEVDGQVVWVCPEDAGADPNDSCWVWKLWNGHPVCLNPDLGPIIRYRIRKPRGLVLLEGILADLPAPVKHEVVQ